MANAFIPPLYPQEYDLNYRLLAQQTASKLEPFVVFDNFDGKSLDIQQVGKANFQAILGRARATVITDTPFSKRRLAKSAYDKADLFDEWDDAYLGKLSGYKSKLQEAHVAGWNRLQDYIFCVQALGGAVVPSVDPVTGLETTTTTQLPSGQKVAIDYVETGAAANSSLTIGKLRQAKYILDNSDADDTLPRVCVITAKELQALLRFTETTDADYNSVRALVEGKIDTYMGFNFKRVSATDVLPAVSGVRYLPCWIQGGVIASKDGPRSSMAIRYDQSEALQVRHTGLIGAVREEEVLVAQIAVDTTLA